MLLLESFYRINLQNSLCAWGPPYMHIRGWEEEAPVQELVNAGTVARIRALEKSVFWQELPTRLYTPVRERVYELYNRSCSSVSNRQLCMLLVPAAVQEVKGKPCYSCNMMLGTDPLHQDRQAGPSLTVSLSHSCKLRLGSDPSHQVRH